MKRLSIILGKLLNMVLDVIRGIAFMLIVSPLILNWFINKDSERYRWILSGPYPFNSFGSGPFQFWMYVVLILGGILLLGVVIVIKLVRGRRCT